MSTCQRSERPRAAFAPAALRTAFHLLYYQLAWTYDGVAWLVSLGQWEEWRRCALPRLRPGPVLELGHGTGTLAIEMAKSRDRVTALDKSPFMTRIASRKARKAQPSGGARPRWLRADAARLPIKAAAFESVVSTFPAEFILLESVAQEVYRVLKPGGMFLIIPSASISARGPLHSLARWLSHATGQAPARWGVLVGPILAGSGFAVGTEEVRLPRSTVEVVTAMKLQSAPSL